MYKTLEKQQCSSRAATSLKLVGRHVQETRSSQLYLFSNNIISDY